MSTRSRIGLVLPDGKVKSVYCHFDGYPEGVGKKLNQYYTNKEDIEALLELGDLSILGRHYNKAEAKKNWTTHEMSREERDSWNAEDWTVPYSSRGEDCPARIDKDENEFKALLGDGWEEYGYLFKKDFNGVEKWFVGKPTSFTPLDFYEGVE